MLIFDPLFLDTLLLEKLIMLFIRKKIITRDKHMIKEMKIRLCQLIQKAKTIAISYNLIINKKIYTDK